MKDYLLNFGNEFLGLVKKIGRQADCRGMPAYLVGGCVRDAVLKRRTSDLDIVVEGDAIALARELRDALKARLNIYQPFGTATLDLGGGKRVDLAKAREEYYPYSGALPVVRAGDLKGDLFRRDFTINAMAICISKKDFGRLVDVFQGLNDLKKGRIRILHDRSFIDDPTRILRAVRFEQRFGFRMTPATLRLLKQALQQGVANNVKPPRYFAEFRKILMEPYPRKPLRRLRGIQALCFLVPHFMIDFRLMGLVEQHVNQLRKKSAYCARKDWSLIFLMALLEGTDAFILKEIFDKFHFTREERASILQSQDVSGIIRDLSAHRLARSDVYKTLCRLQDAVVLYIRVRTSQKNVCQRIDRFWNNDRWIRLNITGQDLESLGFHCGEKMGRVLQEILYKKIDRQLRTKKEELQMARRLALNV